MQAFKTTYGVEVFVNVDGDISVKQEDQYGDVGDLIVIPVERVNDLIRALRQVKKEALEG